MKRLKLNQIVAIVNGIKTNKQKVITKTFQLLQKQDLFNGLTRTYQPLNEEDEKLPDERKLVQMTVPEAIEEANRVCEEMFNMCAAQDEGNCLARADVKIDDRTILTNVPATTLIFLEKQLIDLETFVKEFSTLDPAEEWEFNEGSGYYKSKAKYTQRTRKEEKPIVLYDATKEHPAQTQLVTKDVYVGNWETVKLSGNIKKTEKDQMLERIRKLHAAIKIAREEANLIEVELKDTGTRVMEYIFKG